MLAKTFDRTNSLIVERAILIRPDGKAADRTVKMMVEGVKFTASDDADSVERSGTLAGPA